MSRRRTAGRLADRWPLGSVEVTTGPVRTTGSLNLTNDYGETLGVHHVPGHDFLEVWVDDQKFTFKRDDKAKAKGLAAFLQGWAEG